MPERIVWDHGYWTNENDFCINLRIGFRPFKVESKRGKKKGSTYTVSPVISWKRAREVVMIGRRPSIGLTARAKKWAESSVEYLKPQWPFRQPIPKHVILTAKIVTYAPNKRQIDASNLYQGPEDVLQSCNRNCKPGCKMHAGIIEDDVQIENHNDSARCIDRDFPRVEITLRPYIKKICSWCGIAHHSGPELCPDNGNTRDMIPEEINVCHQKDAEVVSWNLNYTQEP